MRYYTVEKLGPKQSMTPEGFLLCMDVPIARTGFQTYMGSEVPIEAGPDGLVSVERPDSEVFREETIASAWGKPVTVQHPPMPEEEDAWTVDPANWREFSTGVCCYPRRSVEDPTILVADLLICDKEAIEEVRSGRLTEISCGYGSKYVQTSPGKGRQTNILINHIALVEQGRCGPRCAIHDRRPIQGETKLKRFKDVKKAIREAFGKKDEAALNQTLDAVCDEAPVEPEGEGDIHSRLKKVEDAVALHTGYHTEHDRRLTAHDERIGKLEAGEEGEEKVTDEEMAGEVPVQMKDKAMQVRDSSLLLDSYKSAVSGSEVLVPGMQVFTFDRNTLATSTFKSICDLRRQALNWANRNTQDAMLIADARGGRVLTEEELGRMTCSQVRDTFTSVVALKRRVNNSSTSSSAATTEKPTGPRSLAELNKVHQEFRGKAH